MERHGARPRRSLILRPEHSSMITALKRLGIICHRLVASGPAWLARCYIAFFGYVSRRLPASIAIPIRDNVIRSGVAWPDIRWATRRVTLGRHTDLVVHPHLGAIDEDALFLRRLTYEASAFRWLECHVAKHYDTIIEIGANVGIYSIFFDRLSKQSGARLKRIISFEPSQEAYHRLTANLAANTADNVTAFRVAVGVESGFRTFYEPKGYLTCGSFDREFAQIFSDTISAVPVMVLAAKDLQFFFDDGQKVLLKIDAEGHDPAILSALGAIISKYQPDIVVEVLAFTQGAIQACPALAGYEQFLLAENGPVQFPAIHASSNWRDWLLQPAPASANSMLSVSQTDPPDF